MTNIEQKHTLGPWSDWDRGEERYLEAGQHNLGKPVAEFFGPDRASNRRLAKASVTAFESAAARLNLNAVELSEHMQDGGIADLVEALVEISRVIERDATLTQHQIVQRVAQIAVDAHRAVRGDA